MSKMNPKNIIEEHVDIGNEVDVKELKKVESRVLFILYICETKFNIHEMTNKQICDLINHPLAYYRRRLPRLRSKKEVENE